jgi:uncharacterized protein
MDFQNTFSVAAPIDEVWRAMLDVERVAPCVPGAQVVERTGDDAYKVAIKVKLGPMTMTYRGDVAIVEADEAAHRAVMSARAKEARGQGTADATVEMRLTEHDGRTDGTIRSEVAISGRAAAMGQGVIGDVSGRLIETFAANLATMLERSPRAEAAEAAGAGGAPEPAAAEPAGGAPEPAPAEPAGGAPEPGPAGPAGGAAEPAAQARPAQAPPREDASRASGPPPQSEEALPLLPIVGGVIAGRLRDPRALIGVLAAIAALFFALGRRSAR